MIAVWHPEEGGLDGPGLVPNMDPPSWSNVSVQYPKTLNETGETCPFGEDFTNCYFIPPMPNCNDSESIWKDDYHRACGINASMDGSTDNPPNRVLFADRSIALDARRKLAFAKENLESTGQPFFVAVGFRKPHLPFRSPWEWLNVSYPDYDTLPLADQLVLPANVPPISHHDSRFPDAENPYVAMPNATARLLRAAYYSAISWMDSRLGEVLTDLRTMGLENNTVVTFVADHGWNLGNQGAWRKFSLLENAVRVPLLIHVPWIHGSTNGTVIEPIAELIDMFPTISELAGLPPPSRASGQQDLEGQSLMPFLLAAAEEEGEERSYDSDTDGGTWSTGSPGAETLSLHSGSAPGNSPRNTADPCDPTGGKGYALSMYPRCPVGDGDPLWKNNWCEFVDRTEIPYMGYSLRVAGWRYTYWCAVKWNGTALLPTWAQGALPRGKYDILIGGGGGSKDGLLGGGGGDLEMGMDMSLSRVLKQQIKDDACLGDELYDHKGASGGADLE